jgi:Holliday junction resolvase
MHYAFYNYGILGRIMSNAAKAKGSGAERDVVAYLKENGFQYADRRLAGATLDKGDISGIPGVTIEIKNHATMKLSEWTEELIVEMANDKAWTGVVWHKRKGRGSPGDWYCTMPAHVWVDLLRRALGETKH